MMTCVPQSSMTTIRSANLSMKYRSWETKRSVPSNSARVSSRTSRDLFQTLSSSFAFLNIFKLLPLSSIIFLPSIKRILDAKNPKAYKPWDPSIPIIMLLFSFLFVLQCLFIFPLFSPDSRIYRI